MTTATVAGVLMIAVALGDNRTNLADITGKGRAAAVEVNRLNHEIARTFFSGLTEADAATIVALLRKDPQS